MTYSKLIYSPAVLLHLYLLCFPQNNKHLYIMAPVNLHFHKESKLNFSVLHSASICHPNDNILLHACNMVPKIRNYFRCVFTGGGGEGQSCNLHFPLSSQTRRDLPFFPHFFSNFLDFFNHCLLKLDILNIYTYKKQAEV